MITVNDILQWINSVAPFDTQAEYDNSGLLVGDTGAEVRRVLFALDVTENVLDEAEVMHADLLVTHHPLMFNGIKHLTEDDYEAHLIRRMIRMGLSHIAAHTNLDQASGGINDVLAEVCGLSNVEGNGFIRVGDLAEPLPAKQLSGILSDKLHTVVRLSGDPEQICRRMGLCSGGGGSEWREALLLGADAFLTGEMKHNLSLEATYHGLICFECGHFATEEPGIFALADALQKHMDTVKWNLECYKSGVGAYNHPAQP